MKELERYAETVGVPLSEAQIAAFYTYRDRLLEWNEKMNLTAITEPHEVEIKHFLDSLTLLETGIIHKNEPFRLIDVGSGAGFPSLPLLIACPKAKVTMLDSLQKRLTFLETVLGELHLDASTVHSRAEDAGRDKSLREQFDIATARAVANLATLSEYCLPFVRKGGYFLAMKGDAANEETEAAEGAIRKLGGKVEAILPTNVPGERHHIVVIKKVSTTPSPYPRKAGKPTKEPLK